MASIQFLKKYRDCLALNAGLQQFLPGVLPSSESSSVFPKPHEGAYDFEALNQGLLSPVWDMLERPGKEWRGSLCLMTCEALGCDYSGAVPLGYCVELLHNGSLICDDIEDQSEFRRGKLCTYKLFGLDTAINAGNFLYFVPIHLIANMSLTETQRCNMYQAYTEEMIQLHLGQGTDIHWNKHQVVPTEEQYFQMILCKTAVLARLSIKFGLSYCQAGPKEMQALTIYANSLGIAFQIVDDLLNLESEEYVKGRSYIGEDISEGKKTLMVIRTIQQDPKNGKRLAEILRMKTQDQSLVGEALDIIRSTDALQYARHKGEEFGQAALTQLQQLPFTNAGTEALEQLVTFTLSRVK